MNYWLTVSYQKFGLDYISETIRHFTKVGGIDAVAFGTDFDGFTDPPDEIPDPSYLERFTQRLMSEYSAPNSRRYSNDDISKILGRNMLRVLQEGWTNNL